MPWQGAIEPWKASSDGFVMYRKSKCIIHTESYSRSVAPLGAVQQSGGYMPQARTQSPYSKKKYGCNAI